LAEEFLNISFIKYKYYQARAYPKLMAEFSLDLLELVNQIKNEEFTEDIGKVVTTYNEQM
jgi:hypothetical protein